MTNHDRIRHRAIGLAMVSLLVAAATIAALRTRAAGAKEDPYGIPTRIPWTTSRVAGSPEPPPPYQTVRAFPKLQFKNPLDIIYSPAGDRVFVAEQAGKIFTFKNDESVDKADVMIDLKDQPGLDKLSGWKSVQLYGITPHPQFAKNHYFYAAYALDFPGMGRNHENGSRLSRFTVSETNQPTIDPKSEVILLEWLGGGHNGGCIKFGPDGMLYLSTGDGGDPDPPDPFFAGQDVGQLLCKILRLDVDHPSKDKPYSIPADNPFVKTPGARGEVFAYGLRNPWRMNFDTRTGNLWVADVGWELYESVFCAKSGTNCGWSIMEGPNPVHPDGKRGPTPIRPPDATVSHAEAASITGGVVYHGKKLPELDNTYIFGDWQTRRLWAAKCNGDTLEPWHEIAQTDQRIVSFTDQPDGEPIIVDHEGGGLYHLARNDVADAQKHPFPRKLSETGLFISTRDQTPQPGVVPFEVNAAQWVDGATARRWIAVPGTEKVGWGKGVWGDTVVGWPKGSVLVRTLSLETKPGDAASSRHVETQLMHYDGKQWRGYTYAWNDQQTDAELVPSGGDEKPIPVADASIPGGVRQHRWHFPSRTQCATCHNPWCDYTLAFNLGQLDRTVNFGSASDNQIRTFKHIDLLPGPKPGEQAKDAAQVTQKAVLTDPYDASADVNERARSYLHVNCSHCHRFGGGGSALFDVRKELPNDKLKLIDEKPGLGSFGIDDARIIAPGDPARSVLLFRMSKLGRGRMPHIGSDYVDVQGLKLIRQWAAGLPANQTPNPTASPARAEQAAALRTLADSTGGGPKPGRGPQAEAAVNVLLGTTTGAMTLLGEVDAGKLPPTAVEMATEKGFHSSQEPVRDLFRRFDPAEANSNRLGSTLNVAKLLAMPGDAARGREVFIGPAGAAFCSRCHIVNGQGTDFGPDLSHIASKYKKPELLDNILNPSKTIAEGYATFLVQTKDGDSVSGFLVSKTEQEVVLKDAQLKQVRIPAANVKQLRTEALSAMPEGLLGDLEPQQAADLLEFLTTLK